MFLKFEALLYLISTIFLIYEVFWLKKSKDRLNPISSFFVCLYVLLMVQAFLAGICNFIHIPIRLLSLAVINIIIGVLIHSITQMKKKQEYASVARIDIFSLICNVLITGVVAYVFFGARLEVTFVSVDGSAHYSMAKNILINHSLGTNMYFEALNDAILMMIVRAFISAEVAVVKAFVFSQVASFFIGIHAFYLLCRSYFDDWKEGVVAEIFAAFYALGYYLYAVIYGFAYFAQVMNIIICIMILVKLYSDKKINRIPAYMALNLALFSLFVCYSFFVPVVFFAVFIALSILMREETNRFISLTWVKEQISVFLCPSIFGLLYSFSNVKELGSGGGITNEGGCYFDLYSNFLIFLPLIIAGLLIVWKKKKSDITIIMAGMASLYWCVLMIMNLKDRASLYYVSKDYNLLWILGCFFACVMTWEIRKKNKQLLIGAVFTIFVMGILLHTPIQQKIIDDNPGYVTIYGDVTSMVPHIYWFNKIQINAYHYLPDAKIDFFEYVRDNFSSGEGNIFIIGNTFDSAWFPAIAGDCVAADIRMTDLEGYLTEDIDYVVGTNIEEMNSFLSNNGDDFELVYQCKEGYVLAVK